jgi:pSer/pThr/pTyr-binding forkhead associated (FHA) protein
VSSDKEKPHDSTGKLNSNPPDIDHQTQQTPVGQDSISTKEIESDEKKVPAPPGEKGFIQLYLPGREKPLVFKDEKTITFGRPDSQKNFSPTVDLTPDHGVLLGVSREHARIRRVDGEFFLEDLNSSNGTWVNDLQLTPYQPVRLSSGDQIRFAHLMVLVYVKAETRTPSAAAAPGDDATMQNVFQVELTMKGRADVAFHSGGIRLDFLIKEVNQYLLAVHAMCRIIRRIQERDLEVISVQQLHIQKETASLQLRLRGALDVLAFLNKKMPEFLSDNSQPVDADTDSIQADQLADYMLQELVYKFLGDKRPAYIKELSTRLDVILQSPLTLRSSD